MSQNIEQHELYENARYRIKQKKRLYFHFIVFLVGSVFLIILNKIFKVGETLIENWFVWAIILWFFLFILHVINVFVTKKFMDRNWEREQIEKLVKKQKLKIAELEKESLKKIEEEQKLIESKKKENQQNSLNKE
ncbi:2TM domain-containing protein [Lutibacter maritimus]|uniref:2TM domain-containing protein n=1 Tax=Lutibacter maritimus TaxID=593133 RepID=A0A1I6R1U1_9FLAO|nr:2TM domain-containing protein [Lutibacter maritimus]SFS58590.1 2TM domain-containing protein [Lutibacter maritimus]